MHVTRFRSCFTPQAPYTTYINNTEIMTGLSLLTMALYTIAHMKTHWIAVRGSEALLTKEKEESSQPIFQHSWRTKLYTLNTPDHEFRDMLMAWKVLIVVFCIMAMVLLATNKTDLTSDKAISTVCNRGYRHYFNGTIVKIQTALWFNARRWNRCAH